jgi:hypothetical protein
MLLRKHNRDRLSTWTDRLQYGVLRECCRDLRREQSPQHLQQHRIHIPWKSKDRQLVHIPRLLPRSHHRTSPFWRILHRHRRHDRRVLHSILQSQRTNRRIRRRRIRFTMLLRCHVISNPSRGTGKFMQYVMCRK